jgi:hypothetical protein
MHRAAYFLEAANVRFRSKADLMPAAQNARLVPTADPPADSRGCRQVASPRRFAIGSRSDAAATDVN